MVCEEIKRYEVLNNLAEKNGTVIFGGTEDKYIPLCELKQAFEIEALLYNRSIDNLSVDNAVDVYNDCIAQLNPQCIILHIGSADLEKFIENPAKFDNKYRELITHIKNMDKYCNLVVVSLKNPEELDSISEINKHLKIIAESERCEFIDIATKRVWNPSGTREIISFVYSTGFVHPLKNKRPVYDLVKILFCSMPVVSWL